MEIAALGLRVDGVENIGRATESLARLGVASGEAEKRVNAAGSANSKYTESAKAVKPPTDKAKSSIDELAKAAIQSSIGVSSLSSAALKLGGLIGAAFSINAIRQYADTWSDLQSKVGSATGDMSTAAASMQSIVSVANASYAPLQQTVDVFTRNVRTFRDLGKSADEAAKFTEAVNHALVTTSTRGQDADVVINSLSRAMSTGKLDADAFDTIVSRSPRVLQAMADKLKVTTSELRAMATAGKVTSSVIADGLIESFDALKEEASLMPAIITDAFVRAQNNFTAFVGTADKATGASSALAESILGLADGISSLTTSDEFMSDLAKAAGFAAGAIKALAMAAGVVLVARLAAATVTMGAQTAAAIINAASIGRVGVAVLTTAAANAALTVSAAAAGRAMALMGGPIGVVVSVFAAAALAIFDFGKSARDASEDTDALAQSVTELSKVQAESAQFKLKDRLEEVEKEAVSASQMLKLATSDYEALKAAFEQGRGVDAKGLANAAQGVREARIELDKATTKAEQFRAKLGEVEQRLAALNNPSTITGVADNTQAMLNKWLGAYATQSEKLTAELAKASADFGGNIPADIEKRIRAAFATKKSGGTDPSKPGADLIKQMNERIALIGKETEYEKLLAKERLGSIAFTSQAMRDQALGQAQALDFIAEQNKAYDETQERLKALSKVAQDTTSEMDQFSIQAARNIETHLGDGLFNILKGNFDSIGQSFLDMLLKMAADATAANLAGAMFGGFGKTGQVGGLVGSILGSFSSPVTASSSFMPGGTALGSFDGLSFDTGGYTGNGGRYEPAGIVHKGEGVLNQDEIRAIGGEAGFNDLRRSIGVGHARGGMAGSPTLPPQGGGSGGVTVNIIGGPKNPEVRQSRDSNGGLQVDVIYNQFVDRMASDVGSGRSRVNQAMERRYALSPQVG